MGHTRFEPSVRIDTKKANIFLLEKLASLIRFDHSKVEMWQVQSDRSIRIFLQTSIRFDLCVCVYVK